MTRSPRLDTAPGYVAMRFDETLVLVDALAVRDIRSVLATPGHGAAAAALAPAGSLRALSHARRAQIVVVDDGRSELAVACDEVAVLAARDVALEPLRACMTGADSLFVGVARAGERTGLLCSAARLAAAVRALAEPAHG